MDIFSTNVLAKVVERLIYLSEENFHQEIFVLH